MKRIFISTPYTHVNPEVVQFRTDVICTYFIRLLSAGMCPLSPVVVGHPLVKNYNVNGMFTFWEDYCNSEIEHCDEVHVVMLDGWDTSIGVKKEIDFAVKLGKMVIYIDPKEI